MQITGINQKMDVFRCSYMREILNMVKNTDRINLFKRMNAIILASKIYMEELKNDE